MQKTRIVLDPAYTIAQVDPRIFGGFLEHMGRGVYGGVYHPQASSADENGFREDVLDALRGLKYNCHALPRWEFCFWVPLDGRYWPSRSTSDCTRAGLAKH